MTRNAILFHLGDDPFTPSDLGVASHADILLARWGGVRDEPKEFLLGRLALGFSLERFAEVLEFTYLGKYFACVNAN